MPLSTSIIKDLKLYNFRNYDNVNLSLVDGINLFIGKNAQGKTNLIEAVSLLTFGKSFRTSKSKELISVSKKEAAINVVILDNLSDLKLRCELTKKGRLFYVNDKKINKISEVLGKLLAVSFTPRDLFILQGGPKERRSFIDKLIVQLHPNFFSSLNNFNKILASKKELLKVYPKKKQEISILNQVFAKEALSLTLKRMEVASDLSMYLKEIFPKFCPEEVDLIYKANLLSDNNELNEEEILSNLNQKMDEEIRRQRCVIGPQLDDYEFTLNTLSAKNFASQGQSRSIVLASVLASVELIENKLKKQPVILLDDVNSELDKERSNLFFDLLFNKKRQTLITGTDSSLSFLKGRADKVFNIENGKIN